MPTKFSQFNVGGALVAGDIIVGLRAGQNYQFNPFLTPVNSWVTINTSQTLVPNTNYYIDSNVPTVYTLPSIWPFGEEITLVNIGLSTFTLAQHAGQTVRIGNIVSTLGVGGSIESTEIGDTITLSAFVANTSIVSTGGAPQGVWVVV